MVETNDGWEEKLMDDCGLGSRPVYIVRLLLGHCKLKFKFKCLNCLSCLSLSLNVLNVKFKAVDWDLALSASLASFLVIASLSLSLNL